MRIPASFRSLAVLVPVLGTIFTTPGHAQTGTPVTPSAKPGEEAFAKILAENSLLSYEKFLNSGSYRDRVINFWRTGDTRADALPRLNYDYAWRPDGQYVAFFDFRSICIRSVNMRQPIKKLQVDITPPWMPRGLSWSPDGNQLVFCLAKSRGPSALYTVDKDGSNLKQIFLDDKILRFPVWSPDGKSIAFTVLPKNEPDAGTIQGIYVINADGTDARQLIKVLAVSPPSWSPDSKQLAFAASYMSLERRFEVDIYTINMYGDWKQLTKDPLLDTTPIWLPSGYIAFCTDRQIDGRTGSQLVAIKPDGSDYLQVLEQDQAVIQLQGTALRTLEGTDAWYIALPDKSPPPPALPPLPATPPLPVNPPQTTPPVVTPPPVISSAPPPPKPSADIVFHSNRDGNDEVYALSGGKVKRLTNNPANDGGAVVSPDGTKVAFTSNRDGNLEVYVTDAEGATVKRVTDDPGTDVVSSWNPKDPTQLAIYSNREGNYDICVVNLDGTMRIRLTDNAADDIEPAYSPDGNKIAFASKRDGNYEIYVMDSDGKNPVRLTTSDQSDREPSWSPDGQSIVWSCRETERNQEIYIMNADGTGQRRLTDYNGKDVRPTFLDNRTILFASDRDGNMELYSLSIEDQAVKRLTEDKATDTDPYAKR